MSGMTAPELAAAAKWINQHQPYVAVAPPLSFADTARAHALAEAGDTGHDEDGLTCRLVLRPGGPADGGACPEMVRSPA
jgi:hypothetical protein